MKNKKRLLTVLLLFIIITPAFANESKSLIPTVIGEYKITKNYLKFSGLWKSTNKDIGTLNITAEELFCNKSECISNRAILSSFGCSAGYKPLMFAEHNVYKILSNNNNHIIAYNNQTEFTLDINLNAKKILKYKTYSNGDTDTYILLIENDKIEKEIKNIIEKQF